MQALPLHLTSLIILLQFYSTFSIHDIYKSFPPKGTISNATMAEKGKFPWIAYLKCENDNDFLQTCTGTLVRSDYILTAAHCIYEAIVCKVFLGLYDEAQIANDTMAIYQEGTMEFYYHPCYDDNDLNTSIFDIGLVELLGSNQNWKSLTPIALAGVEDEGNEYENETVVAVGWGLGGEHLGVSTKKLLYVEGAIVSTNRCEAKSRFEKFANEKILCGVGYMQMICFGDTGGPIIIYQDGIPKQISLVAFVADKNKPFCEDKESPLAYVRLSSHHKWVSWILNDDEYEIGDCGRKVHVRSVNLDSGEGNSGSPSVKCYVLRIVSINILCIFVSFMV